jgi:undecaprenyl-diphosphatase
MAAATAVTALLPIGSSGHRLAIAEFSGWQAPDAAMALSVSIGMTLAVAGYFWRDVIALAVGAGQIARGRREKEARLLLHLLVASIPVGIAAFALTTVASPPRASLMAIGWISVAFGLLLYVGDRAGVTLRRLPHMTPVAALLIGTAQILALIPGVGRCGIAITVARVIGFERAEAARFALLLALPPLIGAIALTACDAAESGGLHLTIGSILAGATAFVAGLAAIAMMMTWLKERTFAPFALYRIVAGAALLSWIAFG